MKELRCIVFNDREVVKAILDRRQRRAETLPSGPIAGITYDTKENFAATLHFMRGDGLEETARISQEETMAAVIAYCVKTKIPLPADADKFLYLVNDSLTLMITMNFKRQPRCVFGGGAGVRRIGPEITA
jgi:hypothetical protein